MVYPNPKLRIRHSSSLKKTANVVMIVIVMIVIKMPQGQGKMSDV